MDTLPPELKQNVCSNLTPKDLKAVRLTNRDLAAAGARYILPTVYVFNRTESFNDLKEIVEHPTFGKHLETIVYDPRRLNAYIDDFTSWRSHLWKNHRSPTDYVPKWADFEPYQKEGHDGKPDTRSKRAMRRSHELYEEAVKNYQSCLSLAEEMWARHQRVVKEQNSAEFRSFAHEIMVAAFSTCPQLKHLVISPNASEHVGPGMAIVARRSRRLFPDLWKLRTSQEFPTNSFGSLNDVIAAQASIGSRSRHLTMLSVDTRLLTPGSTMTPTGTPLNLDTLRLDIRLHSPETGISHEAFVQSLGASPHLQSLMINLNNFNHYQPWTPVFAQRLASFHWPSLHTLKLREVTLTEDILVAFLLRHRESLQRLAIQDCRLQRGSWDSLFTRIANQLPRLKLFRLQGWFYINNTCQFWFPDSGNYTDADTLALQRFVVEGGTFPQMRPNRNWRVRDSDYHHLEQPMVWEEDEYSRFF